MGSCGLVVDRRCSAGELEELEELAKLAKLAAGGWRLRVYARSETASGLVAFVHFFLVLDLARLLLACLFCFCCC